MKTMSRTASWLAAGMALSLAGPGPVGADEDLAVVKRAVADAGNSQAPASPPAEAPPAAAAPPKGDKPEPRWLRVRVLERDAKGETRKRVSVNLPLSLVRAFDDFPIDLCGNHRRTDDRRRDERRCDLRVADVLAALEGGQELVEVEADDATVKVWVD
jgi:hypothetical protein